MIKFGIVLLLALANTSYAFAQTDTPSPPPAARATDAHPWTRAQALLRTIEADARTRGIRAVEPHVSEMEEALADAPHAFGAPPGPDGTAYVLTDGMAEALVAMAASRESGARNVVAIPNPYPLISLYLGSYYDEIEKYEDALRVLDAGLKLTAAAEFRLGETTPLLISERGAALNGLKRWDDSLANYDDGLKIAAMKDEDRARLFRGRGYALTELRRLDDAEEAYKNSLKLEPGNKTALNELNYIARLRAGGLAEPGKIAIPKQ